MSRTVSVRPDPDSDDCLSAAARAFIAEHPDLRGWDLDPKWDGGDDGDRDRILLTVPDWVEVEVDEVQP